jgi:hypothetical protein
MIKRNIICWNCFISCGHSDQISKKPSRKAELKMIWLRAELKSSRIILLLCLSLETNAKKLVAIVWIMFFFLYFHGRKFRHREVFFCWKKFPKNTPGKLVLRMASRFLTRFPCKRFSSVNPYFTRKIPKVKVIIKRPLQFKLKKYHNKTLTIFLILTNKSQRGKKKIECQRIYKVSIFNEWFTEESHFLHPKTS